MYHLLAKSPGSFNYGTESKRLHCGEMVSIPKADVRAVMSSHPFLIISSTDTEGDDTDPTPEVKPNEVVELAVALNAPALEVLAYLTELSNLNPIPVFKVQRILELYGANKKVTASCNEILTRQLAPTTAEVDPLTTTIV